MPAPPVMDLGSGVNTQDTINKLMELERIPIQRLQQEISLNEIRIKALEEVRNRTTVLADRSRKLYSFAGAFADKSIVSSDPGAITGQASPTAEAGKEEIEIVQLAARHQIHSNPVSLDDNLPASKFVIAAGDKRREINFEGGNIRRLLETIKREADGVVETAAGVNTDAAHMLISLRSAVNGEPGRFTFEDPNGLLRRIGLVGEGAAEVPEKELKIDRGELSREANESGEAQLQYRLLTAGRGVELEGDGSVRFQDPSLAGESGTLRITLEALSAPAKPDAQPADNNAQQDPAAQEEETAQRESVEVGPAIVVSVGDVELRGSSIERKRVLTDEDANRGKQPENAEQPPAKDPQQTQPNEGIAQFLKMGVGAVYKENGQEVRKEVVQAIELPAPNAKAQGKEISIDLAQLTGGNPVEALYFFQPEGGRGRFADLKLQPKASAEGQLGPQHETSPAQDAVVKVNGIEVRRSQNKAITDMIEGLSLDLNRTTKGPVTINVETNTEDVVTQIKEWVDSYNELMLFLRENSRTDGEKFVPPMAGDDNRNRPSPAEQQGIFASDSTVRQLISTLRSQVALAYPSSTKPSFRVLADIGITTGGVGAKWEDIQYGFLQLDEKRLAEALSKNPQAVKELFASDTNEDQIPDNGVAVSLEKELQPYNRGAGGLISSRINMLRETIDSNKDEMTRKEDKLADKRQDLRERFGRMEQAVQQNRAMGNYLKNNLPGGQ